MGVSARFLVAGESLVDLVVSPDASSVTARAGGSPMNVAVGLARLGHEVTLLTRLGDDAHGLLIREHLAASGVSLVPGSVEPGRRTSTATAHIGADGGATYDFEIDSTLPDSSSAVEHAVKVAEIVHVGSLGSWLTPGALVVRRLCDVAIASGKLVSYDPNVRPALIGRRADYVRSVQAWGADVHVFKASAEDLDYLRGSEESTAGADWTASLGRAVHVVTRGSAGATVRVGGRSEECAAVSVEVADTIGAGDSFMAALLDGLARGGMRTETELLSNAAAVVEEVVPRAIVAAAITCSRPGADPPTLAELEAALTTRAVPLH